MKLIKLTVFMVSLLSLTGVAMAGNVGARTKVSDFNGGEFMCSDRGAPKAAVRAIAADANQDTGGQSADSKSAQ